MKVILKERVPSLGNVGEIVNVSAGYARNFLIPGEKAVVADEGNKAQLDHFNKMLAKKVADERNAAVATKGKLDGLTLELIKKVGSNGRLFGTVTTQELSKILEDKGINVERRLMMLDQPIKTTGTFNVTTKLFQDVEANFTVKVEMDPKQAEEMKKKQEAAEKRAAEKKAKAKEAAEKGEEASEEKAEVELTEEQKLNAEADKLLRS